MTEPIYQYRVVVDSDRSGRLRRFVPFEIESNDQFFRDWCPDEVARQKLGDGAEGLYGVEGIVKATALEHRHDGAKAVAVVRRVVGEWEHVAI
jgi:hypothetical protein